MKEKLIQDSKIKIYISFIAITFFASIWYGVFTVNDGLVHYVWAQTGDFVGSSWSVAAGQGRIMYFIANLCSLIPYIFDNLVIYNLFSFAVILCCVYSLWRLLSRHWSRETGFLGVLLYFAFAQADWSHNFFVSYIVVLQGAVAFSLLSMERLLTYYKDKQRKYLVQSALFLVISSSVYESLIFYSVLIFFLAVLENNAEKLKIKEVFKELRFHILFMCIFLASYFIFRIIFPSQYDANTIGNLDLSAAIKTTFVYSVGMFPGTHFIRLLKSGVHVFAEIEMLDFVKAILIGAVYMQLIERVEIHFKTKRKQICYLLIMLAGTILPCILYGFTERHVAWVNQGTTSYGASYYSYYFWILLFTIFSVWFYRLIKHKRIFLIFSVCAVIMVSLMTSISNNYFGDYFKSNYERYSAFHDLLQSDAFAEIEDHAQIYIEGSQGIHGSFDYINLLANKYTGRYYEFITDVGQVDFSHQVYMIKKMDGGWILGRVDADFVTDQAYVFMEQKHDGYSLVGQVQGRQELYADGLYKGIYEDTFIVPVSDDQDHTAVLEGVKINIDSLQMADRVLEANTKIQFIPQEGFYGKEGDFWWAANDSVINIKAEDDMLIHIRMRVVASVETANLKITAGNQSYDYTVEPVEKEIALTVPLQEGDNFIQLACDGKILSSMEDPREKVIRIFEPLITALE